MSDKFSWKSWWSMGAVGAYNLQKREAQLAASRRRQQVALYVSTAGGGGGGLVASTSSLTDHILDSFWKVYCVTTTPNLVNPSPPPPSHNDNNKSTATAVVKYIQCAISNPDDVRKSLSTLTDVTHIFYVAEAEDENSTSTNEFRNILTTIMAVSPRLKHVGLQVSRSHCSGACKPQQRLTVTGLPTINEDDDEDETAVDFSMEDVLVEEISKRKNLAAGVKWSVHHPAATTTSYSDDVINRRTIGRCVIGEMGEYQRG